MHEYNTSQLIPNRTAKFLAKLKASDFV